MIDQTAADSARGISEKGAPVFFVAEYSFVECQKHDAEFFVLAFYRRPVKKLGRFCANKSHVLTNQGVRGIRISLRRIYLFDQFMSTAHKHYPPDSRIRKSYRIIGVVSEKIFISILGKC